MKLWIASLLFTAALAHAGITGNLEIEGTIVKYDKHTVTMLLPGQRKMTVPRSNMSNAKLKAGTKATAVFTPDQIMDRIREQQKK